MLNRFQNYQLKKDEKIKKMKLKLVEIEDSLLMNKNQIKGNLTFNEDFLIRMEKNKELLDEKKRKMIEKKEEIIKEEELRFQHEKDLKFKAKKFEANFVEEKVKSIYDWDKNRKEKISHKIEQENQNVKKVCTFKPEINKYSDKIVKNKKLFNEPVETVTRLYKQDIEKRKNKKKILKDIYIPSFNPVLLSSYKNKTIQTETNFNDSNKINAYQTDYNSNNEDNFIADMLRVRVKTLKSTRNEL
jgi:hypothetical protein